MKQKIVVKVVMITDDSKRWLKALKTVVGMTGILSAALDGSNKDQLVVVSDGLDAVELTKVLRKKMGHAELISVGPVRENIEKKDKEGGDEKKDKGGGGKGGGGTEKKDKPEDSEKKDKEGGGRAGEKKDKASGELRKMGANKVCGGRAGEKKDKASGELRKMGANKVYGGWFMYGPGTCAEAVLDEPKQEEWLLTVAH